MIYSRKLSMKYRVWQIVSRYLKGRSRKSQVDEHCEDGTPSSCSKSEGLEIGQGRRWYDYIYRALRGILSIRLCMQIPFVKRDKIVAALNWLIPFYEHDCDIDRPLDSWMHNLHVPASEHVVVPSIWLVELFLPSDLPDLKKSLHLNGWNFNRSLFSTDASNQETLDRARSHREVLEWKIVSIARPGLGFRGMNSVTECLPEPFDMIEIQAVQVGQGLTAVVVKFDLQDDAACLLDVEWHMRHEPRLILRGARPCSLDRREAAMYNVQSARLSVHQHARDWLASRIPGFFNRANKPHPVLDLMLFDLFDPIVDKTRVLTDDQRISERDAFRALGVQSDPITMLVSDLLPKFVLGSTKSLGFGLLADYPIWTLSANRAAVTDVGELSNMSASDAEQNRYIAYYVGRELRYLLVMVAVSYYLEVTEECLAQIRDHASLRHGRFRLREVNLLRKNILSHSLDLVAVHRGVAEFWELSQRLDLMPAFNYVRSPRYADPAVKSDVYLGVGKCFDAMIRDVHEKCFERLLQDDQHYRDILSTVSSLGSSVFSSRIGWLALIISAVTLFVAVVTLFVS